MNDSYTKIKASTLVNLIKKGKELSEKYMKDDIQRLVDQLVAKPRWLRPPLTEEEALMILEEDSYTLNSIRYDHRIEMERLDKLNSLCFLNKNSHGDYEGFVYISSSDAWFLKKLGVI